MLTENDRPIVEQALIRLAETFRVSPLSKTALTDYFEGIKELSPKQFFQAINYLRKHHKRRWKEDFPLPADIVSAVEEGAHEAAIETKPYEVQPMPAVKSMTPEEHKEFSDYLKEQFERGQQGRGWTPMPDGKGHELVDTKVVVKILGELLNQPGLATDFKRVLRKVK